MSFAPTPFSEPVEAQLIKLAGVSYSGEQGLNVFWEEETQQVFFQVKSKEFRANGSRLWESCGPECTPECMEENDGHQVYDDDGDSIYDEPLQEWWTSSDANILESIAFFTNVRPSCICFSDLFVFNMFGHGKAADEEIQVRIYVCDWSDFAGRFYLEFGVARSDRHFSDNFQRAAHVLAYENRPYDTWPTYEDEKRQEAELRMAASEVSGICFCVATNPDRTASTVCDSTHVGELCNNCDHELAPEDRDWEIYVWKQYAAEYRGWSCMYGCEPMIEQDHAGNIHCATCSAPAMLQCTCGTPTLYRMDTVKDGKHASPTCGLCFRHVPEDVLVAYEQRVQEFVADTGGRL